MNNIRDLSRTAMRAALDVRDRLGIAPTDPICVFNVAEQLDLSVRYIDIGSLEGMYCKTSATIILPTGRPPGRQAFACAHELGHWHFGHGSSIDQITELADAERNDPNDQMADAFAGFLLMPPRAVKESFLARGWNSSDCDARQYYAISTQLGVSYEGLIRHMQFALRLIDHQGATSLLRYSPKDIRRLLLGEERRDHLVVADRHWKTVSIDLQVGEAALVPPGTIACGKPVIAKPHPAGCLVEAHSAGVTRLENEIEGWSAFVRVSRKGYVGQHTFRHMEDDDE